MPPQSNITSEFESPEVRKDGYKGLILPWIILVLDGVVVRELTRKGRGPGSSPSPG